MQNKSNNHGRIREARGMATMAVVMMFVLIGVAVLSMSLLFAAEVRRTRATATGSQLRQLLLAGTIAAQNELRAGNTTERNIAVNVPIAEAQLHIHLAPTPTGATAAIVAILRQSKSSEHLQLTRRPDGVWNITDATLLE